MLMLCCTHPNLKDAQKLGREAVILKKAACVQIIGNCFSIYEWENKIEENEEVLMLFKTLESNFDDLSALIQSNHPYEVPEIVAFSADKISSLYKKWLFEVLKKEK